MKEERFEKAVEWVGMETATLAALVLWAWSMFLMSIGIFGEEKVLFFCLGLSVFIAWIVLVFAINRKTYWRKVK